MDCYLAKVSAPRYIRRLSPPYINAFSLKLHKNKNLQFSFKATADAADQGKLFSICGTPDISERNFCVGFEIKFTSPLGGIQ